MDKGVKIKKLYEDIKQVIPKELHYPIKICSSYPQMVRILVEKDKINKPYKNVAKEFILEVKEDKIYNRRSKYTKELANKYPRRKLKKYTRPILGFAGNPILLNGGVLNRESKYYVAAVIMHEIGHNIGYSSEGNADKFALEWMEKIEPLIRRGFYG